MSAGTWTRCGGRSSARPYRGAPWRAVESQHHITTRPLVDTKEEHRRLEALLDIRKPPMPPEVPEELNYLLATPFRYYPLQHGSRFGTRTEGGIWYGADRRETCLAEVAYYFLVFLEDSEANLLPRTRNYSLFQAEVRTQLSVDVRDDAFATDRELICSPMSYVTSQELGRDMRADGIEAVRYPSARDPEHGMNVGVFSWKAFASMDPISPAYETWLCSVSRAKDVLFAHDRVTAPDTVSFPYSVFLVGGNLPIPAA